MEWIGPHLPRVEDGDLAQIQQPIDFLGVNHYRTHEVAHEPDGSLLKARLAHYSAPGWGNTDMGWGINPQGLKEVLLGLKEQYGNPTVHITENGCALPDAPNETGTVADGDRIDYLGAYLRAAHEAIEAGVDLRSYYVWSLMDNFEWARGYGQRFGLVRVEAETLKRIPKQSAAWYRQVIRANGIEI
jgi:beta-glucosidase